MGVYHSIEVEGTLGFQRNFQECLVKHVIMRHVSVFAMCVANNGCRFASRFHSLVPIGWLLPVPPCSISSRDGFLFPISFHRDYGLFEKYKTRNGTFVHSLLSDRINHSTTRPTNVTSVLFCVLTFELQVWRYLHILILWFVKFYLPLEGFSCCLLFMFNLQFV